MVELSFFARGYLYKKGGGGVPAVLLSVTAATTMALPVSGPLHRRMLTPGLEAVHWPAATPAAWWVLHVHMRMGVRGCQPPAGRCCMPPHAHKCAQPFAPRDVR